MNFVFKALAFAQEGGGGFADYSKILVWVLLLGFFYLIIIRPQQKQQKAHKDLMTNLVEGDQIVTIGGFKGQISKVKEDSLLVKFGPDTELEIIKNAVGRKVLNSAEDIK